jgi:hypothetical protein
LGRNIATFFARFGIKNMSDLPKAKLACRKQRTLPFILPPAWKTGGREGNQKKKGFVPIPDNTHMTRHEAFSIPALVIAFFG